MSLQTKSQMLKTRQFTMTVMVLKVPHVCDKRPLSKITAKSRTLEPHHIASPAIKVAKEPVHLVLNCLTRDYNAQYIADRKTGS
jgi:hypothetical protein